MKQHHLLTIGAATLLLLTGCSAGGDGGSDDGLTIAFLMPESNTTRYEQFDRPLFEAKIEELAPGSKILYSNANGDPTLQQSQLESVLAQAPDVVVLNAADSVQGASLTDTATSAGVPVIAYDRFIDNQDIGYYVSFDNPKVGALQAQSLVDHLAAEGVTSGDLLMVNGAPTDPNAAQYKAGAHSVIDESPYTVVGEFDTPNWAAADAQQWVEGQLGTIDRSSLVGVYAGNDSTASGVVAALTGAGISPVPPVTGQDAELEAVQRIVAGTQYMTVYKSIKQQAEDAATAAIALAKGEKPDAQTDTDGIPTTLLDPIALTAENIADTVVADEVYSVADICSAELEADCAALGLK